MRNDLSNQKFIPKGKTDKQSLKQGKWKDYIAVKDFSMEFENGFPQQILGSFLLYCTGIYKNNKKEGLWHFYKVVDKTWDKILHKSAVYKNGKIVDKTIYYYPSGEKALHATHNEINKTNNVVSFYITGDTCSVSKYIDDKKEGMQYGLYKNGKIRFISNYHLDQTNGEFTSYYENGQLKEKSNFKNGKVDGIYKYYYDNGQPWIKKLYVEGKLMEVYFSYSKDGIEKDKGTIKKGSGTVKYYTTEGDLYSVETYKEGVKIDDNKNSNFK